MDLVSVSEEMEIHVANVIWYPNPGLEERFEDAPIAAADEAVDLIVLNPTSQRIRSGKVTFIFEFENRFNPFHEEIMATEHHRPTLHRVISDDRPDRNAQSLVAAA